MTGKTTNKFSPEVGARPGGSDYVKSVHIEFGPWTLLWLWRLARGRGGPMSSSQNECVQRDLTHLGRHPTREQCAVLPEVGR